MCLGIPGRVDAIEPDASGMTMGTVSFAGVTKRVCLAYVPDVAVGDYVLVHVGFAISIIGEREAREVFEFLRQVSETGELATPQPDDDRLAEPAPSVTDEAGR